MSIIMVSYIVKYNVDATQVSPLLVFLHIVGRSQVEDCLNPKERLKVDAYRAPVKSAPSSAAASRASPASASPLQV